MCIHDTHKTHITYDRNKEWQIDLLLVVLLSALSEINDQGQMLDRIPTLLLGGLVSPRTGTSQENNKKQLSFSDRVPATPGGHLRRTTMFNNVPID